MMGTERERECWMILVGAMLCQHIGSVSGHQNMVYEVVLEMLVHAQTVIRDMDKFPAAEHV
jgi:hypothetical protein